MKLLDIISVLGTSSLLSKLAAADSTTTTDSTPTDSSCNPLKTTGCSADTALATSFSEDFSSSSKWFTDLMHAGEIEYGKDGLSMTLAKRYDNPSLKSNFYLMYGKVEVIMKAASGTGIVSSFYLQSDDLDEIDIEWVGSDNTQFQSNFFSKGDTTTYDRGQFHGVDAPTDKFHNYTLDWAMDQTTWYLDGESVRVLSNTSSEGYPQSPMYLMMGIWAGGDPSNAPGTIEWAGGETNYADAPFTMYIEKVIVTDYSTGKQYTYGDQSGSWESIKVEDGSVYGRYEQAQEDFAALANGGSVSSSSATSSATSSSATSSSASSSATSSAKSSSTSSSATSSSAKSSSAKSSSAKSSSTSSSATSSSAKSSSAKSSSVESSSATSSSAASPSATSSSATSVSSSSSVSSSNKQSSTSTKKSVTPSTATVSTISSTSVPTSSRSTVAPTTQQSSASEEEEKGGVATSSNNASTSSATQRSSEQSSAVETSTSETRSISTVQTANGANFAQSLPREGKLFSLFVTALLALF